MFRKTKPYRFPSANDAETPTRRMKPDRATLRAHDGSILVVLDVKVHAETVYLTNSTMPFGSSISRNFANKSQQGAYHPLPTCGNENKNDEVGAIRHLEVEGVQSLFCIIPEDSDFFPFFSTIQGRNLVP